MSTKKKPAKKQTPKTTEPKAGKDAVAVKSEEQPASDLAEAVLEVTPESDGPKEPVVLEPKEKQAMTLEPEQAVKAEGEIPAPITAPSTPDKAPPAPDSNGGDAKTPVVGDVLTRQYKGKQIRVEVVDGGFRHEGTTYKSLSALAKILTGYKSINGRKFFNVGQAPNRPKGSQLATRIKKLEARVAKQKDALEQSQVALNEAEAERATLAEQAGSENP